MSFGHQKVKKGIFWQPKCSPGRSQEAPRAAPGGPKGVQGDRRDAKKVAKEVPSGGFGSI